MYYAAFAWILRPRLSRCSTLTILRRLSAYLGAPVARLSVLASGWETTVFEFTLEASSRRCASIPVGVPMVLRFYQGSFADAKGAREHTTIDCLFARSYPVPRPYAFESDHHALGAPFFIMQKLAGGQLFAVRSFPSAFKTFSMAFFSFVRTQSRLHKLDPLSAGLRDIPRAYAPVGTQPPTRRCSIECSRSSPTRVETGPLPGLREALNLVTERAPKFRRSPVSLVHMDYHPLNVMVDGVRVTGVIDWVNTDVGDRHLDAAMTAVILSSSALDRRDGCATTSSATGCAELRSAVHAALSRDGADGLRAFPLLPGGRGAAATLDDGDDARARPEFVGFRREAIDEVTPAVVKIC